MQKIVPNLWFDRQAEEAVAFYLSVFKDSKMGKVITYGDAGAEVSGMPKGSVMLINFELLGMPFTAINGGPEFKFTEAVSFLINCRDQDEVDYYWERLTAGGGQESVCGWLKDKYGLSWQVIPTVLERMLEDTDSQKTERVMAAMLQMKKIDIERLKMAAEEE